MSGTASAFEEVLVDMTHGCQDRYAANPVFGNGDRLVIFNMLIIKRNFRIRTVCDLLQDDRHVGIWLRHRSSGRFGRAALLALRYLFAYNTRSNLRAFI